MPLLAGQRITAAKLYRDMGSVGLTDAATLGTSFGDWGTETVTFDNPGVEVTVRGIVTGHVVNSTATGTRAGARVAISLDGGSTFTFGNDPLESVSSSNGNTGTVAAEHLRTGTPTGDIVVKAQAIREAAAAAGAFRGRLTADIIAT